MKDVTKWRRANEFANADVSNEAEAIARLVNYLDAFGAVPELNGLPAREHPGLARVARETQPDLRTLLRGLEGNARSAGAILREHESHTHYERKEVPRIFRPRHPVRGKGFEGFFKAVEALQKATRKRPAWLREELRTSMNALSRQFPKMRKVRTYRDPLDPVCELIRERNGRHAPPVRVCQLPSCGRFFLRRGRRLFCSPNCHSRFHSKGHQMGRTERRAYQYEYRARRLWATGGRQAIRQAIEKLQRRRGLSAGRKRERLAFLGRLLRSR